MWGRGIGIRKGLLPGGLVTLLLASSSKIAAISYAFSLAHKLIAKARKGDGGVVALAEESPEPCLAAMHLEDSERKKDYYSLS